MKKITEGPVGAGPMRGVTIKEPWVIMSSIFIIYIQSLGQRWWRGKTSAYAGKGQNSTSKKFDDVDANVDCTSPFAIYSSVRVHAFYYP